MLAQSCAVWGCVGCGFLQGTDGSCVATKVYLATPFTKNHVQCRPKYATVKKPVVRDWPAAQCAPLLHL